MEKLYNILKEENMIDMTEDYPVGFDINELKSIRSFNGKLTYVRQHLGKPIGTGSGREVYRVDDFKVLKMARNQKGLAQNETEADWYGEAKYYSIIANIIDFDENYTWIEMEIASKAKKSDFKRLWNVDFDKMHFYISNRYQLEHRKQPLWSLSEETRKEYDDNEYIAEIMDLVLSYNMPYGDIVKLNSWGIVKRENEDALVLVDLGLSEEVFNKFYKK